MSSPQSRPQSVSATQRRAVCRSDNDGGGGGGLILKDYVFASRRIVTYLIRPVPPRARPSSGVSGTRDRDGGRRLKRPSYKRKPPEHYDARPRPQNRRVINAPPTRPRDKSFPVHFLFLSFPTPSCGADLKPYLSKAGIFVAVAYAVAFGLCTWCRWRSRV